MRLSERLSDGSRIEDWNRPLVPVTTEVYEPEPPDPTLVVLGRVLDALEGLREALGGLPAPMVHVAPPNLDPILAALANGTPPPSADAIAEAIAKRVRQPESQEPLAAVMKEAFDKLDKRLAFPVTRPASGGGAVSLANDPNRQVGIVTVGDTVDVRVVGTTSPSVAVATVTASGDTTVITPTAGKKLKVYWVYAVPDPDSTDSPLIKVSLGGTEIYRAFAISHAQEFTGTTDGTLVVNLSAADANGVAVTVHYEEIA